MEGQERELGVGVVADPSPGARVVCPRSRPGADLDLGRFQPGHVAGEDGRVGLWGEHGQRERLEGHVIGLIGLLEP